MLSLRSKPGFNATREGAVAAVRPQTDGSEPGP